MNLDYEQNLINSGYQLIAGLDEVGRGPLAGPVVAAAVIFSPNFVLTDDYRYLADSKKMTEKRRLELFPLIKSAALACEIAVISHATIDRINILEASLLAMAQAVKKLSVQPDYLLIDGKFTLKSLSSIPQKAIINGDALIASIAAASVIAKVSRDWLMTQYHQDYPHYGFDQHKGYGTKAHLNAINQHGPCHIHRLSFAPLSRNTKHGT